MSVQSLQFDQALHAHRAGDLRQAEQLYRSVIGSNPTHHAAWHLLGVASYQTQQPRQAVDYIRTAIGLCQTEATYYRHLAAACVALEDWPEAAEAMQSVCRLNPADGEAAHHLGQIHMRMQQWPQAVDALTSSVAIDSSRAAVWFDLAQACEQQGDLEQARQALQRVVSIEPRHAIAWNQLGTLWQAEEEFDKAAACYQSAIEHDPACQQAWSNWGTIHQLNGEDVAAMNCYERALRIDPQSADLFNNLGVMLKEAGQRDRARENFELALRIDARHVDAHHNRALLTLQEGDLEIGWNEYAWRWKLPLYGQPAANFPAWQGPDLPTSHVWFYAEQGLGDEIMFASCFQELIDRQIESTIECDARLLPIYRRSFPGLRFLPRPADASMLADFQRETVQCPLGDMPKWFRKQESDFPRRQSYLLVDPDLQSRWNAPLQQPQSTFNIGIAWQGGKDPLARRQRTTALAEWEPLFRIAGIRWWNLQHGPAREEWETLRMDHQLDALQPTPDVDPLRELDSYAALISRLDLIISIDNSTVHLAGALGRPTWVLLPAVADWRWFLDRSDSPWYASLTLFRQREPGDWQELLQRVSQQLAEIVATMSSRPDVGI